MIITVERKIETEKSTIGMMYFGTFQCNTMELPKSDSRRIPSGTYDMSLTWSPKFQKARWLIEVPNRSGIRIHKANQASELEGCIAIGVYNSDKLMDWISDSTVTYNKFWNKFMEELKIDDSRIQIHILDK